MQKAGIALGILIIWGGVFTMLLWPVFQSA